jgi:hypothetical protein
MSDGLSPVSQKKSRPVNVYDVPPKLAYATEVESVGMVTLTAEEELQAWKRSRGENARLATELAKASLAEANGKSLSAADGSLDTFWSNLDPKLRQLILTAYADLHAASEEDQKSFLGSRKVKVA